MNVLGLATMLCVRDLPASTAFYRDVLGFHVLDELSHIVLLQLGRDRLYLFAESPPTEDKPSEWLEPKPLSTRGSMILVLRVDDCNAAYEEFRRRGAEFLTPPKAPPWGGQRCFLRDPDGYVVEIEEEAQPPARR